MLGYVDLVPPFFIVTVLAVIVGSGLMAGASGKRRVGGWIALACGIIYSVIFWTVIWAFTDVRRDVSVSAKWHFEQWGDRRIAVLDAGNPWGGFEVDSPQFERYLDTSKRARVHISIPCYYNFGVRTATGVPETADGIPINVLTDGKSPPRDPVTGLVVSSTQPSVPQ